MFSRFPSTDGAGAGTGAGVGAYVKYPFFRSITGITLLRDLLRP